MSLLRHVWRGHDIQTAKTHKNMDELWSNNCISFILKLKRCSSFKLIVIRTGRVDGWMFKKHSPSRWSTVRYNGWEAPFFGQDDRSRYGKLQNRKHEFTRPSIMDNFDNIKCVRAVCVVPLETAWAFGSLSALTKVHHWAYLAKTAAQRTVGPILMSQAPKGQTDWLMGKLCNACTLYSCEATQALAGFLSAEFQIR